MRREWVAREAAGKRSSSSSPRQGGAVPVRGRVPARDARVRVFIFRGIVVFVLVTSGVVLLVVGAGRA